MIALNLALVVASLATSANAFYPYIPGYMCEMDGSCPSGDKRGLETDAPAPSLKIVQRLPEDGSPPNIQRIAEGLRRKYQRVAPSEVEQEEQENVVKRQNTHSVVSASPPTQTNSAGIDQDGTDYSYFAQVQLGSTKKDFYLLLDSGAGTTWVMGSSCTSGPCKTHENFSPSDSTTFKNLSKPFSLAYGSGSVSGTTGQDSLSIAGFTVTTSVGIATTVSDQFNAFPIDGILGLSLAQTDGTSFWESLKAAGTLKANLIGMALNRNSDGPNTGEINFGAVDTSRFSGSLDYFPSQQNAQDDWAVQIDNIGVGTTQTGISSIAYIDTGTSFIFAPPADAKKLHASVSGAQTTDGSTFTVPCTTTTPLNFSFGSKTYSVSSKDWVSASVNGVCTSNVYGIGVVDQDSWLVGDTFLKNVYTVFDYDQSRVGFAQVTGGSSSSSSSSSAAASSSGSSSSTTPTSSTASSTASITGSSTSSSSSTSASNSGTQSNSDTTGSSSGSSTQTTLSSVTGSSSAGAYSTGSAGLNGHETPSSTTGAASQAGQTTSSPSASSTKASSALLLSPSFYSTLFAAGTLITLLF